MKKYLFLSFFIFTGFHLFAQGPAGIGTSSTNLFWFKADAITAADNTNLSTWQDQTLNNIVPGFISNGITFAGASKYGSAANYSTISNNFTMEAWVMPSAAITTLPTVTATSGIQGQASGQKYLIHPTNYTASTDAGAGISVGTNGIVVYEQQSTTYMPPVLIYNTPISSTSWTHIAVVYTAKKPSLYINGILTGSVGSTSPKTSVHPSIELGGGTYGNYSGSVDELRIWNYSKTPTEISTNYNKQIVASVTPITATALVGGWRFDEGSGSAFFDDSGVIGNIALTGSTIFNSAAPAPLTNLNPVYYSSTNTINGKPVVSFNGAGSKFELPSNTLINSAPSYSSKAFSVVIKTGTDVTGRQVIYEQGDVLRGLNMYILGGKFYINGWNTPNDDPNHAPWGPPYSTTCSTSVAINSSYVITFLYDSNRDAVEGYVNGGFLGTLNGIGKLFTHPQACIGYAKGGTKFHDASFTGSGFVFNGAIGELAAYTILNSAERKIIENYLSSKYSILLSANDYFAFEATHSFNMSGVGQDNVLNASLSGVTPNLTLSATSLTDGYFAMFADNNQSILDIDYLTGLLSTPAVNAPKDVKRMLRTWRIDASLPTGNLNFKIPQSLLAFTPTAYQKAVLILDSDGDFKTGSRVIGLDISGTDYTVQNVPVLDGDYVSFGILQQYDYTSPYSNGLDALGKADQNYEDVLLISSGLSVRTLANNQSGNYLLLANQNGSTALVSNNTPVPTDMLRATMVWKVNQYGNVGSTELTIDPSFFSPFPLPTGKTFVILIDRLGVASGNFSNAEMIGCVKEGSVYKANYVFLNNTDLITIATATASVNEIAPKVLTQTFDEGTDHHFTNGSTLQLNIKAQRNFEYATACTETIKKATLNLNLNTGIDYIFGKDNPFTAAVGVEVKGYSDFAATTLVVTYNANLTLDQTAPEMLHFINITGDYTSVKVYKVRISSFTAPVNTLIKNSLLLNASIVEETQVITPVTSLSVILNTAFTASTGNKIYTFQWQTDHCNAPLYQFQLLRLYNKGDEAFPGQVNTNLESVITADVDWNKALTLETVQQSLALTLTEGTGYYLWRVRPVGNSYSGGVADNRNWGSWSSDNISISSPLVLSCSTSACLSAYQNTLFYYDQFDRTKNFIYSRSFTEDAKIHEGMTYANGLMQVKQTQGSIPSNNGVGQIVAGQTLYDYSGRPSLQSLQAPIQDGSIELGYRNNLVKDAAASLYGPKNFDTDSKLYAPDAVDPVNGGFINQYYSDYNPDGADINVPGAENYPLSRTVYDNEGTGRMIEQGGPGLVHKIGAGHTVHMQYGSVSDDELIRVFGDEAPDATSVYKVATTDQNNITSIAYIDKTGKTIATCLAKNALASNLTPLTSEAGAAFTIQEILTKTVPYGDHGNKASKALNFTETTVVTITYDITPAIVSSFCGPSYCATCKYLFKLKVMDLANSANNKVITFPVAPPAPTQPCSTAIAALIHVDLDAVASGNTITLTLPAGKYIVEKIIELDQSGSDAYVADILQQIDASLQPTVDAITAKLNASDISGLNTYLFGLQTTHPAGMNVEVYSDAGAALFSLIDVPTTNDVPLSTLVEGYKVNLVTTCCNIKIPIIFPEFDPCNYALSGYTNATLGNYFDGVLFDKTGGALGGGKHVNDISAYSQIEFAALIANMLNEPAGWYTCANLWNCWKNAVFSDGKVVNQDDQGNTTPIDVGTGIKTSDNYNDQPQWGKDLGNTPNPITTNIMQQFLDCAGRNYVGFTTDATLLKAKPYKYFLYNQLTKTNGQRLCEDAFCNYTGPVETAVINPNPPYPPLCGSGTGVDLCPKAYPVITDNSLSGTIYTLNVGTSPNLHVLSIQDYFAFYQCILNEKYDATSGQTVMDDATLNKQKNDTENACNSECDKKYNSFLENLTAMNGASYNGPELQINGHFSKPTGSGGWVDINSNPSVISTLNKNLSLTSQPSGKAISTAALAIGTTYYLKCFVTIDGTSSFNIYNGATVIANNTGTESINFSFVATSATLTFEGTTSGGHVTLDDVDLYQTMPALAYPSEDLCCTARELVDYCKQSCTLTIQKTDCSPVGPGPEDKFLSLGTQVEIDRLKSIMYGSFDIQVKPGAGSCAVGYEDVTLFLGSFYNFSGNANDGSGNGLTGTVTGATLATDKDGVSNNVYSFNGTTNYISAGTSDRNVTNSVTIAAWVQTNSASNQAVVSKMNSTTKKGYQLVVNGGFASFQGYDGTGSATVRSSGNSTTLIQNASTWYYLVGVCNNGTWQIWVNGVKENESTNFGATNLTTTDPFTIGKNSQTSTLFFSGKIDEVSTYSAALPQHKILDLYTVANGLHFSPYTSTPYECLNNVPHEEWQKQFGTQGLSNNSSVRIIEASNDGGYIWITTVDVRKISAFGGIVWQRPLSIPVGKTLTGLKLTSDGGYILTGEDFSGSSTGIYVVKYDATGLMQWQGTFGNSSTTNASLSSVEQTADGGYILGTNSILIVYPYTASGLVIKLNSNGTTAWQKAFTEDLYSIKQHADGGYLIVGNSFDVIKIDIYGNILWNKNYYNSVFNDPRYGSNAGVAAISIDLTSDGGFVLGSKVHMPVFSDDYFVLKADQYGDVQWMNNFGGTFYEILYSIVQTADGGYLLNGSSQSDISGTKQTPHYGTVSTYDYYVIKIGSHGEYQWEYNYGGTNQEDGKQIIETSDHKFIITGHSNSDISGNRTVANVLGTDDWTIKIGTGSNQSCNPRHMCIKWIPPAEIELPSVPDPEYPGPPIDVITITTLQKVLESQLAKCKATNTDRLKAEYNFQCGSSVINDKCEIDYTLKHHHYTLYYYDRANNLVKTVPPKGVVPLDLTLAGVRQRMVHPSHNLITKYKYNSLGQLVQQITPDAGTSNFIYNALGQLRFAQDARQFAATPAQFSYTKYDYLSRIIEVGKATLPNDAYSDFPTLTTAAGTGSFQDLGMLSYPVNNTSEQTNTVYTTDATNVNYLGIGQRFLQNRVSYTYSHSLRGEESASYFSYDPHGNVEWMVQEIPGFSQNHIGYEYDLISNKVLKVKFNENKPDQFFHKYDYDADNRITAAYTSKNGLLWDKDAAYKYYKQGPLKRIELGEDKIQGMDYAYTLQGWLKGVNTPTYDKTLDPGGDGTTNTFLKDEYGMMLGYFNGDFNRTGSPYTYVANTKNYQIQTLAKPLYNGNISSCVSRVEQEYTDFKIGPPIVTAPTGNEQFTGVNNYTYDHLNRILTSDFSKYNGTGTSPADFTATTDYHSDYTYDDNGNILTLNRKGFGTTTQAMDNLTYNYLTPTVNNQLNSVTDLTTNTPNYPADIDNQTNPGNYAYDNIGNMVTDNFEQVTISWNMYGKIDNIAPISPSAKFYIAYTYDAMGNRIKKEVNTSPYPYTSGQPVRLPANITTTYYVRDASGNVMGIYERINTAVSGKPGYFTAEFRLKELPLNGSTRLGEFTPNTLVASKEFIQADMDKITFENQVLTKVTENTTWTTSGVKTDAITDNSSQPVNVNSVSLQQLAYVSAGDNYTVTPASSFLGTMNKNIALAEDQNGVLKFYAVTAANYWGTLNACLIYDATGKLMPNGSIIDTDPAGKAIILRKPGSSTQYYLFTKGIDGQIKYSLIDMTLGTGGDVVSGTKSIVLDKSAHFNYGTVMQGLEDDVKKEAILYATRYNGGTMDIVAFTITSSSLLVQDPDVLATVNTLYVTGYSDIQISPDSRKLLLYNHKNKGGWFYHIQQSEIIIFNLGVDYKTVLNPVTAINDPIAISGFTRPGASADFSKDNRFIYFTADLLVKLGTNPGTEHTTWRYDMRDKVLVQVNPVNTGYMGDIRRGKDGRMHIDYVMGTSLPAFTEDAEGVLLPEVTAKAINVTLPGALLSGGLPMQVHRIYCTQVLQADYTRLIGLKSYEMNDHLGNVTVVIGDRRGAVLGTGVTNSAEILNYNNYYPFGMIMPGKSKPNSLYRYGFNGKEMDNEIKGSGNSYDYGERIYDARLGRWLSLDLAMAKYPNWSPYHYTMNNPIFFIDPNGKWSISNHARLTFNSLKKFGITDIQAGLLAHYVSVFADHPSKSILLLNNIVHNDGQYYWNYRKINYDLTKNSQVTTYNPYIHVGTNYNIWHSMRSPEEEMFHINSGTMGISAEQAKTRGIAFGWSKIFESAQLGKLTEFTINSAGIQAFGQGFHALQDAEAHKGCDIEHHDPFNDAKADDPKDFEQAAKISDQAIIVHKLVSGDYSGLNSAIDFNNFNIRGMSVEHIKLLKTKVELYNNSRKLQQNWIK